MNVTTTSMRQGKFETRFWHKVYEEEVGRVKGHFGPINTWVFPRCVLSKTAHIDSSIAVHPKGLSYASGGEDGFVRVHNFDDSYFKTQPYGDLQIEDWCKNTYVISSSFGYRCSQRACISSHPLKAFFQPPILPDTRFASNRAWSVFKEFKGPNEERSGIEIWVETGGSSELWVKAVVCGSSSDKLVLHTRILGSEESRSNWYKLLVSRKSSSQRCDFCFLSIGRHDKAIGLIQQLFEC